MKWKKRIMDWVRAGWGQGECIFSSLDYSHLFSPSTDFLFASLPSTVSRMWSIESYITLCAFPKFYFLNIKYKISKLFCQNRTFTGLKILRCITKTKQSILCRTSQVVIVYIFLNSPTFRGAFQLESKICIALLWNWSSAPSWVKGEGRKISWPSAVF